MTISPIAPTLPTPPAKRVYVAPALVVHGNVQTITQNAGPADLDGASRLSAPQG